MIKIINTAETSIIQLFGDIGESWFSDGWTLEKFKAAINSTGSPALTIELKSNGGDVFEAFAIYDAIRAIKARVTVDVIGTSASAATIIASAADKVRISENSRYLVHNAQTFVDGNKEKLKDVYDQLVSIDNQILDVYVKRTGKSRETLASLMTEERFMTASEALDWGFVDEIIKDKPKINNMKKFQNLTEQEQAEMDQLLADKAALEQKVAELEAQLSEMTAAAEKMEEEQIEAEIEAAVKAGKIKADAKQAWMNLGKKDRTSMTMAINAIYVPEGNLRDVPAPGMVANPSNSTVTKDQLWSNFKSGKIDAKQYAEQLEKLNK